MHKEVDEKNHPTVLTGEKKKIFVLKAICETLLYSAVLLDPQKKLRAFSTLCTKKATKKTAFFVFVFFPIVYNVCLRINVEYGLISVILCNTV